eukprot:m.20257 g.20257  ORF g.20257 m.20257 type:complete len:92 (+) comp12835_c0_seq1:149-424(+)
MMVDEMMMMVDVLIEHSDDTQRRLDHIIPTWQVHCTFEVGVTSLIETCLENRADRGFNSSICVLGTKLSKPYLLQASRFHSFLCVQSIAGN